MTKTQTQYDPATKRYTATCEKCSYTAVKAKREAAQHALDIHVIYTHG